MRSNFPKYCILFFVGCVFELLLDEPRTMLVTTEFDHMPMDKLSSQGQRGRANIQKLIRRTSNAQFFSLLFLNSSSRALRGKRETLFVRRLRRAFPLVGEVSDPGCDEDDVGYLDVATEFGINFFGLARMDDDGLRRL